MPFRGTRALKRGLLELAEGGTILLNEIGELPLALQSKLLSFLDTRQFTPVGGVTVRSVNARLIAATNQDIETEVRLKRFRKDLIYRLAVLSLEIPPLRERNEDVPLLVACMLPVMAERLAIEGLPAVSARAMKALASYGWPGNVRELRNVLESALILCDKKTLVCILRSGNWQQARPNKFRSGMVGKYSFSQESESQRCSAGSEAFAGGRGTP